MLSRLLLLVLTGLGIAQLAILYMVLASSSKDWIANGSLLDLPLGNYLQQRKPGGNNNSSSPWEQGPQFTAYLKARQEAQKFMLQGMERGKAVPFLADSYRIIEHHLAFAGRFPEALSYAEKCAKLDFMMAESSWQQPADLAELALVYTELGRYKDASQTYGKCIKLILDSDDPDVRFILPQRFAQADLAKLLKNESEYQRARQSADDISRFLYEISKSNSQQTANWSKGDPAQVYWDERWWSARIVEVQKERLKVHFVGFPSSEDGWFEAAKLRSHPLL